MQPDEVFEFVQRPMTAQLYRSGMPPELVRERIDVLATHLTALTKELGGNEPEVGKHLTETAGILHEIINFPQLASADLLAPVLAFVKNIAAVARPEYSATVEGMESVAAEAAECYAKISALPGPTRTWVADWFHTHLPGTGEREWIKLILVLGDQFATSVECYAKRAAQGVPTGDPAIILEKAITAISATPTHAQRFTEPGIAKTLNGRLKVLDERRFNLSYIDYRVQLTVAHGGMTDYLAERAFALVIDIDSVLGFCDREFMYLRDRDAGVSACIHEAMHLLSSPAWKMALGNCLNEGATEYFSRAVCDLRDIPYEPGFYRSNVSLLNTIMKITGLDPSVLEEAYFGGEVDQVREAIIRVSGAEGLRILTENAHRTDAQTAQLWREQRQRHQQGDTTAKDTCTVQ